MTHTLGFQDEQFKLIDDGDLTKRVDFEVSGVATGTTRTIAVADRNITLDTITTSTDTAISGFLRGDGSNITSSASVSLTADVSGVLPLANGGAGIDSSGATDGQLLVGGTSSNDLQLATITGTANQVTVVNGTNTITLSGPQDLATTSDPTFGDLTVDALTASIVTIDVDDTPYSVLASDYTILADNNTGSGAPADITVNLPAAASNTGRILNIKKIDAAVQDVIIDGNAAETIDGAATLTISSQFDSFTIQSNGSNWFII